MSAARRSPADRIAKTTTAASAPVFRRPTGRATYPHRTSLDLDPGRYHWLKRAAYDTRVSGNDLLRALMALAQDDAQLLAKAVERAQSEQPPPT